MFFGLSSCSQQAFPVEFSSTAARFSRCVRAPDTDGWKQVTDKKIQCCVVLLSDDPLSIFGPVAQWLQPCSCDSPIGNIFSSIIQKLKIHGVYRLVLCVHSTLTLQLHRKIKNNILKKTKAGFVVCGNHQDHGIYYDESPSSFLCLESLRTLLALSSMDEDNVWRWQSPTEEPGCMLVLSDGDGGHVAHRAWSGDESLALFQYGASCPKRMGRSVQRL